MIAEDLFNLIESIGPGIYNNIDIIDTSDNPPISSGEKSFRIHHSKGYCFDIKKELEEREDDLIIFDYIFTSEWEGFKKLTTYEAYKLLKKIK